MKFLQEDSPIAGLLSRFMDLILLNVFWVICSLPVVTLGASTTALYDTCMKLALHEDISIIQAFFRSFAHHLKRGTLLFLITLAAGLFLAADFWCALQWDAAPKFFFQVLILSVAYFYVAAASHAFPALAYFDEPVLKTIRHGFVLAMRNGIYTVFIMVMDLLPFLVFFLFPGVFWKYLFLFLTIIIALLAYLNSLHLVRLFDPGRVKALEEELAEREKQKKQKND